MGNKNALVYAVKMDAAQPFPISPWKYWLILDGVNADAVWPKGLLEYRLEREAATGSQRKSKVLHVLHYGHRYNKSIVLVEWAALLGLFSLPSSETSPCWISSPFLEAIRRHPSECHFGSRVCCLLCAYDLLGSRQPWPDWRVGARRHTRHHFTGGGLDAPGALHACSHVRTKQLISFRRAASGWFVAIDGPA
jgi:hypothetical protein